MKRLLSIVSTACIALSLTACGESKTEYPDYVSGNDNQDYFPPIMETDYGYYSSYRGLIYNDKETGKCVYLCSKPECPHDGSDYCAATGGRWRDECFALSGEYIYFNAVDIIFTNELDETNYKLFKASLNGSELTEICTYNKFAGQPGEFLMDNTDFNNGRQLVVHRGKAVVPFKSGKTAEPDYNTVIVDIETGTHELLATPEYDLSDSLCGQCGYYPSGEFLYYTIIPRYKENTTYLYRYEFSTKQTEQVEIDLSFSSYAVNDGKIYYTVPLNGDTAANISVYDTDSGETEVLAELDEFCSPKLMFDGTYLFITENSDGMIADLDGNTLAEFTLPEEFPDYWDTALNSTFGKLYFRIADRIYCCAIADIIAGSAEWYEPYNFEEFEPVAYNFDHLF